MIDKEKDAVYLLGYESYFEGVRKEKNPFQYSGNVGQSARWITGWIDAAKSNLETPNESRPCELKE